MKTRLFSFGEHSPHTMTNEASGLESGANRGLRGDIAVEIRQIKYLNNIALQDHRAVKRNTRPMLDFKSFRAAASVLAGIELMHMIRKGQRSMPGCEEMSFANQFYALAGQVRPA